MHLINGFAHTNLRILRKVKKILRGRTTVWPWHLETLGKTPLQLLLLYGRPSPIFCMSPPLPEAMERVIRLQGSPAITIVQSSAIYSITMYSRTMQCSAMHCSIEHWCTVQWLEQAASAYGLNGIVLCIFCTVQHSTRYYIFCTVQHYTRKHWIHRNAQLSELLLYTALHMLTYIGSNALHCTVL